MLERIAFVDAPRKLLVDARLVLVLLDRNARVEVLRDDTLRLLLPLLRKLLLLERVMVGTPLDVRRTLPLLRKFRLLLLRTDDELLLDR